MSDRRQSLGTALAAFPLGALVLWWALDGGGYAPAVWLPGAIVLVALAALAWWPGPAPWPAPARPLALAVAALAAFTAWSYLSTLWADVPGDAWLGSHRTLLYLAAFALTARLTWTLPTALAAGIAFVAIATVAAAVTLLRLRHGDVTGMFIDVRLADPTGYSNADAALWTMAALPALVLGASRATPWALRPPLLAASALLLEMSLLSQSRGWLFTLPVVVVALLVLTPGRLRIAVFSLVPLGAVAFARTDLLAPYDKGNGRLGSALAQVLNPAVHHATTTAWLGALGALVVGVALVLADRRIPHESRIARRLAAIGAIVVVVGLAGGGGAAALVATHGHPIARLNHAWSDFKDPAKTAAAGANHFTSLGSGRYDFWRVAVDLWRAHPVGGIGQDNFAEPYVRLRANSLEETRWVHSLPLRLLTQNGSVGALLFVAFVLGLGIACRRRDPPPGWRTTRSALLLPLVVWMAHGSVDWLWEVPVLSVAALGLAGIAAAGCRTAAGPVGQEAAGSAPARAAIRIPAKAALVAGALLGSAAMAAAFVSDREVNRAASTWGRNPSQAFGRLSVARRLDPLSDRPYLIEGLIAAELGRRSRARTAFENASSRDPGDWYPRLLLGLQEMAGGPGPARAALRGARRLNPLEPVIAQALSRVGTRHPLGFNEAQQILIGRAHRRQGR
ncbi:MAG: hypothetical protein QOH62_1543 [Solirubrobacteraceae bacterium]|nr:hypothetical protein [Solirubrobacteraceae bacterium]